MKKGSHHNPESLEKIRLAKLGTTASPETKAKLSEAHKGIKPWNYQMVYGADLRQKISDGHKGIKPWNYLVPCREETKEKIRQGNIGVKRSPETKARMSEAQRGNKNHCYGKYQAPFLGMKHDEETKQKMSEAHIGQYPTPETLQKISGENNHFYGKHHKEETKQKLREMRQQLVIPTKDTSIELKLQAILTELNILFEKHKSILGQPDVFIEPNICVFADGCFWHNCNKCFDETKFTDEQKAKIIYDESITQKLRNQGYIVLRFWEHDINNNIEFVKGTFLNFLKKEK